MRKICAIINIDEEELLKKGIGTIDYLKREFGWLKASGIFLEGARIIDEDDKEDTPLIKTLNEFF